MAAGRLPGQNVPIRPVGRPIGEIAWAIVPNRRRRDWSGRPRPVLVAGVRRGDRVIVVPFTSRKPPSDRKRQITDLRGTGLRPPVWIWDSTVAINEGEIGEHLGWINREIFESLDRVRGLTPGRLQRLKQALGELSAGSNPPNAGGPSDAGSAEEKPIADT